VAIYTDIIDPDNGAGTDYTSLAAWEANAQTDHSAGASDYLVAECRASSGGDDTTAVRIDGLSVAGVKITQTDFPTNGKLDTSKYVLNPGNYTSCLTVTNGAPDVEIDKLQIVLGGNQNSETACIKSHYMGTTDIMTIKKVIALISSNNASLYGFSLNGDANSGQESPFTVSDCILYHTGSGGTCVGIRTGTYTALKCYNSTIYKFATGCRDNNANVEWKNIASFGNTDDFSSIGTILNCASDDADGTNAIDLNENALGEWTAAFTDYANGDFSVKDTSSLLYNTGASLAGTVDVDIIGTSRPQATSYDIGAFEYITAADVEVTTTTKNLTLTENAANINAETSLTVGVDSLTLTTFSATVDISSGDINVEAVTKELTLTRIQAGINAAVNVAAGQDALTLTEKAANINYGLNVSTAVDTLVITTNKAVVKYDVDVFAVVKNLTITENSASINAKTSIQVIVSFYALTGNKATVQLNVRVEAVTVPYTLTEYTAMINAGLNVQAILYELTLTENVSTILLAELAEGLMDVAFSLAKPGITFSMVRPGIDFTINN
jgi:hypothetical protein